MYDKFLHYTNYDLYSYGHALDILEKSFDSEFDEILSCLDNLEITHAELMTPGGNESPIPAKFDSYLWARGWREIRITGDLLVKVYPRAANARRGRFATEPTDELTIPGWIDGHNIDFVKNRVAFDLEWNSKDQTFDRDILAMRTYHECGIIDVGIIVTRAEEMNRIFRYLEIMSKYGASTTWIGKLLPRLDSRRQGGCPILAVAIRPECVTA